MTDIDDLRRALQAPAAADPGGLHIGQIMAKGRRVRRRRRLLAVSGSACLAAALFAAVSGASQLGRLAPGPGAGTPGQSVSPGRTASGHPVPAGSNAPYGDVISTGIRNPAGELVFYGVRVHLAELPGITFGIMGGYRDAPGQVTPDTEENETTAPDDSPGFHAVGAPISVNGQPVPEFGYYAGPAVKITGTAGGRTIQAAHARWSVNPRIVIFWFPPASNPGGQDVTGLAAYDAAGDLLPAGHNQVGHG